MRIAERYPALRRARVEQLRLARRLSDGRAHTRFATTQTDERLPLTVVRHSSLLRRRLGQTDPRLQEAKVHNLRLAGVRRDFRSEPGLCQLSNLLYWMALHAPLEVIEHHHHSFDPFPDDRRVLPFGSGAGVFYNYVDLRLRNPTDVALELVVAITEEHLRGRLLAERRGPFAFHVEERGHRFVREPDGRVFRQNELWRRTIDRRNRRGRSPSS